MNQKKILEAKAYNLKWALDNKDLDKETREHMELRLKQTLIKLEGFPSKPDFFKNIVFVKKEGYDESRMQQKKVKDQLYRTIGDMWREEHDRLTALRKFLR